MFIIYIIKYEYNREISECHSYELVSNDIWCHSVERISILKKEEE